MASSGPLSPASSASDSSVGDVAWTNPGNVATSNDTYATAALGGGAASQYLKAQSFGFAIPGDATIDGIQVSIERKNAFSRARDERVRLVKGGTVQSTDKASATIWPTTDTAANYGGAADTWGGGWTPADVNSSTFGAVLQVINTSVKDSENLSVDHITITVHYTEAGGATAPDAIDDLAAAPGITKLTLTWSAPDNGGATITKYTLYLNGVEHTDSITSPHVVTGLTPGVESGDWTVTATNSEGESDPSNEVAETPYARKSPLIGPGRVY